jgi:hypothetical protein
LSPLRESWNPGYNLMAANPITLAMQVVIPPARPATAVGYSSPRSPHDIKLNPMLAKAWNMHFVSISWAKPECCGFETRWGHWNFSIYLVLPAAQGPGVHSF